MILILSTGETSLGVQNHFWRVHLKKEIVEKSSEEIKKNDWRFGKHDKEKLVKLTFFSLRKKTED